MPKFRQALEQEYYELPVKLRFVEYDMVVFTMILSHF